MIGVFPAEVDQLVDHRVGRIALRIDVVEHRREPSGIIGFSGRMALGSSNGTSGMTGRRATMVSSSGLNPDGVFPAQLRRFGWNDDVVPGDPVDDLYVIQVEVDRVGIDAVVRDAPDLGSIGSV